jgi:hypothetical protein
MIQPNTTIIRFECKFEVIAPLYSKDSGTEAEFVKVKIYRKISRNIKQLRSMAQL